MSAHAEVHGTSGAGRQAINSSDGLNPLLGAVVRIYRMDRRWRQEDLAARVQHHSLYPAPALSRSAISQVELGQRALSLDELVTLSAVFKTTLVAMLQRAEDSELVPDVVTFGPENYVELRMVRTTLLGGAASSSPAPTWAEMADLEARITETVERVATRVVSQKFREVWATAMISALPDDLNGEDS